MISAGNETKFPQPCLHLSQSFSLSLFFLQLSPCLCLSLSISVCHSLYLSYDSTSFKCPSLFLSCNSVFLSLWPSSLILSVSFFLHSLFSCKLALFKKLQDINNLSISDEKDICMNCLKQKCYQQPQHPDDMYLRKSNRANPFKIAQ